MDININDYFIMIGLQHLISFKSFKLAGIKKVKDLWNYDLNDLMSMEVPRYQAKRVLYRKFDTTN